jgi:hypothetical protein
MTRILIPFSLSIFTKEGVGNFTKFDQYHIEGLRFLNKISTVNNNKHVVFIHFFSPHYYPLVEYQKFEDRIQNANDLLIEAVEIINKNDENPGIIILSDHGYRNRKIPEDLWNKNILFYKNIDIDTTKIINYGSVEIFNSINY